VLFEASDNVTVISFEVTDSRPLELAELKVIMGTISAIKIISSFKKLYYFYLSVQG
jgi:hypothetical protein